MQQPTTYRYFCMPFGFTNWHMHLPNIEHLILSPFTYDVCEIMVWKWNWLHFESGAKWINLFDQTITNCWMNQGHLKGNLKLLFYFMYEILNNFKEKIKNFSFSPKCIRMARRNWISCLMLGEWWSFSQTPKNQKNVNWTTFTKWSKEWHV